MSLYDALQIGVSGLDANSRAMSIFSSNIANVNTVGYKTSSSEFETMLGSADGGDAGLSAGVMANAQANIAQQGAEFATQSPTDLAITGNGFFCVNTAADQSGQMLYTRAGSFLPDGAGDLRNSAGLYLLGYPLNADGSVATGSLAPVNLNGFGGKGEATATMSISANLDSDSTEADSTTYAAGQMIAGTVTPDFQTTMNVYDSQGGTQPVQVSYVKLDSPANTWAYEVGYTGDPSNISSGNTPAAMIASGTLTFGASGELESLTGDSNSTVSGGTLNFTIPWSSTSGLQTSPNQSISFDMGTIGKTDGTTQLAAGSAVNNSHVDGAIFGTVTGETIGADGTVYANYSNGLTQAAFKIPLATFANPDGLSQASGNAYLANASSGAALINQAQSGGSGSIQAYALEGSTVDLATEFTNMITTQQAYSASARVVTTASQMLDTLMQIQR